MKKKNLFVALCAAFVLTLFAGCKGPEPPRPTPPDPTPAPSGFVPIVELDGEGKLAKIPYPFIEFSQGKAEMEAWEKEHGSEFAGEKSFLKQITYSYNTKDPQKLCTVRKYDIDDAGKGKLTTSTAYYKAELLYDLTSEKPALNSHFKQLLEKEGFKRRANSDIDIYVSEKMILTFSRLGAEALVLYMKAPAPTPPSPDNFVPIVEFDGAGKLAKIPYPFVEFTKGKAEMEAWEKKHGSQFLKERPNDEKNTTSYSFKTNDPQGNNPLRNYTLKEKGKGKLQSAIVTYKAEIFFDLSASRLTLHEHVKQLLAAEGYKPVSLGETPIIALSNRKFLIAISLMSDKTTAAIIYLPEEGSDPTPPEPAPDEIRKPWYLPLFEWKAPISEKSPVIEAEKARGFSAEWKPADPPGTVAPRRAHILSLPPFDKEYGSGGGKVGILYFSYEDTEKSANPGTVESIAIGFNAKFKDDKRDCKDEELKQYFLSEGFAYKGEGKSAVFVYTDYYHSEKKVHLRLNSYSGFTFGSFVQMDTWSPDTANALHAKVAPATYERLQKIGQ